MPFILEPAQDLSTAQTKLTVNPPKITDGTRPPLPATETGGIAMERSRGSMLLIWLPPGNGSSQLSQLLALGILPVVSTPTSGAAGLSDNMFFSCPNMDKIRVDRC